MGEKNLESSLLTLSLKLRPSAKDAFSDWQADLNQAVAGFPGFISLETTLWEKSQNEWIISQRFDTASHLKNWQESSSYRELIKQLSILAEVSEQPSSFLKGVTEVFVTAVDPKNVKAYRNWTAKIHQAESKFPGFKGTFIQAPEKGGVNWITFLQFDTPENLDNWIRSKERKQILDEGRSLIASLENHRMISPFAGWFKGLGENNEAPPAWKQAMIVLLVLFPVVMLEMRFLNPHLQSLNSSLAVFIGNSISVTLVTWPLVPFAISLFSWWLIPQGHQWLINTLGTLLMLALYALEIALLWNLL